MQFLDITLPTPEENLALDEALLLTAEADGTVEYLRVWESPCYFVVLGKNCRIADDVYAEKCLADGVPVFRRISGGGTVLIGPGCLNFSLVLRFDRDRRLSGVAESFRVVLDRVLAAVQRHSMAPMRAESSDLVIGDRKFGGNCQRRQRTCLLQHGTILYNFDLNLVPRYLREPRRQPTHRRLRDHLSFLTNLPAQRGTLCELLQGCWLATPDAREWPKQLVATLVREKYADPIWALRR